MIWLVTKLLAFSKTSTENNSETNGEEIPKEIFIPPELRHRIINDLILRKQNYWIFKI